MPPRHPTSARAPHPRAPHANGWLSHLAITTPTFRNPWLPQIALIVSIAVVLAATLTLGALGLAYDLRLLIPATLFGAILLPALAYWLRRAISYRRAVVRAYLRHGIDLARK